MDQQLAPEAKSQLDLRAVGLMLRRHLRLIAGGAGLGLVIAFALLVLLRPQYTAVVTLMVDSRQEKVLNTDAVLSRFEPSSTAIASEAAVIMAPSVLKRVVDKLELANDNDFKVTPHTAGVLGTIKSGLLSLLGQQPAQAAPIDGIDEATLEISDKLRKSMEVTAVQYTNLINVGVTSKDPRKAARLANAIADAYLVQQLDGRYQATRRVTDWLVERIEEHKDRLRKSEERFEALKANMDLVDKEGTTLEEKQLVRLNEELVLARARTSEARAKYQGVSEQANGSGTFNEKQLAEFVQSALITQLRTQLAQVTRDEDSLSSRFGSAHPAVVRIRAEKRGLNAQIADEVHRIVAILKNEYDVAASREKSLQESLKTSAERTSGQRGDYVKLRELQREAESDKALYEAMLQRMKQTAAQESWKTSDFRIVAEAVPPLSSSQPKTRILALAGLVFGLCLGFGASLAAEFADATLKRGRDIEAKLGVPHLVDVPLLPAVKADVGTTQPMSPACDIHLAAQHAGSKFSDAMLALHGALQARGGAQSIKTVLFTSARSGEGKSVIASNYAQTAARAGLKVLLLCTDLRTPTFAWFAPDKPVEHDLVGYLSGNVEIEAVVARIESAKMDIVPATRTAIDAAALIASPRMQKLIEWAKANYDLVVIDAVSILPALDGRMLARHADATVVVVEWLATPLEAVKETVELLLKNDAQIAGAVLNKVDPARAGLYGLSPA